MTLELALLARKTTHSKRLNPYQEKAASVPEEVKNLP
jgi:hypothetical protein